MQDGRHEQRSCLVVIAVLRFWAEQSHCSLSSVWSVVQGLGMVEAGALDCGVRVQWHVFVGQRGSVTRAYVLHKAQVASLGL